MRLSPSPQLVDWTLFALTVALAATGIATGFAGVSNDWWVFAAHGTLAMMFAVFFVWKLQRVATRLHPTTWDAGTKSSIILGALALVTLGTGIAWTWGAPIWLSGVSVVTLHAVLGVVMLPLIGWHLWYRYHGVTSADIAGRRTILRYTGFVAGGALLWRGQRIVSRLFGTVSRFTGSRLRGRFSGNAFPRTEWVADDPDPIDTSEWSLTITGAVSKPVEFQLSELDPQAQTTATLDCTSGWYTIQHWRGIRLGDLIETADPQSIARYVTIISVTGYRWTFPIEEAESLLLATHSGDTRLNHAHGYPIRLVAPGHRGYRWVKWIDTITLRQTPDVGKWVAIFVSGFE